MFQYCGKLLNRLPLCFRQPNRTFLSNGKHPRSHSVLNFPLAVGDLGTKLGTAVRKVGSQSTYRSANGSRNNASLRNPKIKIVHKLLLQRFKTIIFGLRTYSLEGKDLYDFLCICNWSVLVPLRFQKPKELTLGQEGNRRKNSCYFDGPQTCSFFSNVGNMSRRRGL